MSRDRKAFCFKRCIKYNFVVESCRPAHRRTRSSTYTALARNASRSPAVVPDPLSLPAARKLRHRHQIHQEQQKEKAVICSGTNWLAMDPVAAPTSCPAASATMAFQRMLDQMVAATCAVATPCVHCMTRCLSDSRTFS